jgi:DNA gyrase subunit A
VLKEKKGSKMTNIKALEESGIKDFDYYRTQNIPAVGCYLKDEDMGIEQIVIE